MAKVVLGLGTSHAPIMTLPPEKWQRRRTADMMEIPIVDFQGKKYPYEELEAMRKSDYIESMLTLEKRTEHQDRCQSALDTLSNKLKSADVDTMVIIGDDHYESFKKDIQPMMAIFYTETVTNKAVQSIVDFMNENTPIDANDPEVQRIISSNNPDEDTEYPIDVDSALHLIETSRQEGFDVTAVGAAPAGPEGVRDTGHSVSYIYRRLLNDAPVKCVPVLMNTYFPPNQPTVKRCIQFGRMLGKAILSMPEDKKVALVASGGLSHFAIDEDWDKAMIDALEKGDFDYIMSQPEDIFVSGTSETKNWITVAAALDEIGGFKLNMLDYIPCYRASAGTGTGAAFGYWDQA